MDIKMKRDRMLIKPENVMEEVYLEEIFKLKSDGDSVKATRKDAYPSVGRWAHLEIK